MTPSLAPEPPPRGAGPFPDWRDALARSRLPRDRRGQFATEIARFLRFCEILAVPVSWPQARRYLATVPHRMHQPVATQALRWFFRAARAPRRPPRPAPAAPDFGWWVLPFPAEDAEGENGSGDAEVEAGRMARCPWD